MLQVRHSHRAANAAPTVSPAGELFVASVVVCMMLAAFGDAADPTMYGVVGIEFALFDLAGEFTVLAMRHWHFLQLLAAGSAIAAGVFVLRLGAARLLQPMRPAQPRAIEKVPIEL